ncbi:DUF402 domain-containing protein [Streptomyces sp. NPDC018000]|uniref:DUF402 domain-containing protein n=1 Tax=Streptomyces sp. NPDC018000 TaxID=3365028 RepID=UPI0037960986
MRRFGIGETVVRRDVYRGRVWSEQAMRVVADTDEALVTACCPGAGRRWPSLYARASIDGDRSLRTEAFDAMVTGNWDLTSGVWQETVMLVWKPPVEWFSVNAFYDAAGHRLRNWYVNFEHPIRRTGNGFDSLDLVLDLVIAPDLADWTWKDEDEYAHVRRLGIVSDGEHRALEHARAQVLAMLDHRTGPFSDTEPWPAWRWDGAWRVPELPGRPER